MATERNFLKETTIYVSASTKLNFEQIQHVKNELLRIIGYPNNYTGFKFHFVEEGGLVEANASVDSNLRVSIGN